MSIVKVPHLTRILLIISLTAGYIALYLALHSTMGTAAGILVSLPAAATAWFFGLRIGLGAAVAAILLNTLLVSITSATGSTGAAFQTGNLLGYVMMFIFTTMLGLVHDLSGRLRQELARREEAEQIERQRNAELEGIYHASLQLTSSLELKPVLETILSQVSSLLNAMNVNIFLYDDGRLTFGAALWEGKYHEKPFNEPRPEGLTYIVARTGTRVVIPDTDQHPLYKDNRWGGAIAGFPLSIGDRVYGVMNVAFAGLHHFSDSEVRVLELMAAQAAIAIRNARTYESSRQHAAELEEHVAERTVELLRAKESAEALLNNSFDVILLLSADGVIQKTNPAFDRVFGIEDGQGRQFATLFQDEVFIGETLNRVVTDQAVQQLVATACRAGGDFSADLVFVPLDSPGSGMEIICNLRDVSERKRADMRQQALTQGLRKVLALTYELIASPDIDSLWKRAIESAREVLGLERCAIFVEQEGYMIGTYGTDHLGQTTDERDQRWLKSGHPWNDRAYLFTPGAPLWDVVIEEQREWHDGEAVSVGRGWIVLTPIQSAYRFIGFFVNDATISGAPVDEIQQEITALYCSFLGGLYEHKRVEDEIRRALEREKELSELKSRFTSMISHELRTPLTSIQLSSDLLKSYDGRLTPETRLQHLNKIQRQVKHLTNLLEDVLTFTKAEQIGLQLQLKSVDLRTFCAELCAEVRATHSTHQVLFPEVAGKWWVSLDPKLMRQALMNLLLNAVKYSAEGTSVTLTLDREDQYVVIRVSDEGMGIPETELPHIFEVFYRAKNVGTVPGTGLGLALVRQIAEAHHGFVYCESQLGKGTSFTLRIPTSA